MVFERDAEDFLTTRFFRKERGCFARVLETDFATVDFLADCFLVVFLIRLFETAFLGALFLEEDLIENTGVNNASIIYHLNQFVKFGKKF